jgi:hypothetical protein
MSVFSNLGPRVPPTVHVFIVTLDKHTCVVKDYNKTVLLGVLDKQGWATLAYVMSVVEIFSISKSWEQTTHTRQS